MVKFKVNDINITRNLKKIKSRKIKSVAVWDVIVIMKILPRWNSLYDEIYQSHKIYKYYMVLVLMLSPLSNRKYHWILYLFIYIYSIILPFHNLVLK